MTEKVQERDNMNVRVVMLVLHGDFVAVSAIPVSLLTMVECHRNRPSRALMSFAVVLLLMKWLLLLLLK